MTSPRDGLARSVQTRLAKHARTLGVDPNLVLTRYAVERFLYRLSISPHADRFVLKGALLILAWLGETLRPTRDADFLGFGDLSDDALIGIIRDVCSASAEPDAVSFDPASINLAPIRDEDAYGGRRITLVATIGAAQVRVQVDVGIGDVITPGPEWLDYPTLLDLPHPHLRTYPRETVVAEKVHAMAVLGSRNSRMKDYFDLHALFQEGALSPDKLGTAIAATFARRRTALPDAPLTGLSDAFASDATNRGRWAAFVDRNRLNAPGLDVVVASLREALAEPFERARASAA